MEPSADSSMHCESPTDATVITHPSIMTNVTVVPEERAEKIIHKRAVKSYASIGKFKS